MYLHGVMVAENNSHSTIMTSSFDKICSIGIKILS
jgi:hypothetical protein